MSVRPAIAAALLVASAGASPSPQTAMCVTSGATVRLEWDPSTQKTDGTPIPPGTVTYTVMVARDDSPSAAWAVASTTQATNATLTMYEAGPFWWRVVAGTPDGRRSQPSNVVGTVPSVEAQSIGVSPSRARAGSRLVVR